MNPFTEALLYIIAICPFLPVFLFCIFISFINVFVFNESPSGTGKTFRQLEIQNELKQKESFMKIMYPKDLDYDGSNDC